MEATARAMAHNISRATRDDLIRVKPLSRRSIELDPSLVRPQVRLSRLLTAGAGRVAAGTSNKSFRRVRAWRSARGYSTIAIQNVSSPFLFWRLWEGRTSERSRRHSERSI